MVWLARTGAPWRDLPARYGSWKTVASRFYRRRREGIFARLLARSAAALMPAGSRTGWSTTSRAVLCVPTSTPPAPATSPPNKT
jgi:transposase